MTTDSILIINSYVTTNYIPNLDASNSYNTYIFFNKSTTWAGPSGKVILFSIVLIGAVPLGARGLTSKFLAHIAGKLVVAVAHKLSQA